MSSNTTVTDLTLHPDFELAVAPLRAQIDRLNEDTRFQRENTAVWRQQLVTTTAEQHSLAADKISLSTELDRMLQKIDDLRYSNQVVLEKLRQQHADQCQQHANEVSDLHQQNNALRKQCDDVIKRKKELKAELKQLSDDYHYQQTQHAQNQNHLRGLQDTHQATVEELNQLRVHYSGQQAQHAQDQYQLHQMRVYYSGQLTQHALDQYQLSKLRVDYNSQQTQHAQDQCHLRKLQDTHEATVKKLNKLHVDYKSREMQHAEDTRKANAWLQHLRTLQVRYHEVLDELRNYEGYEDYEDYDDKYYD